jgi:outer membrane protein assembly factor BamD (BamD/ComL family)
LERYLSDYPSGNYATKAQEKLALLDAKVNERDDAAWTKAKRRNSRASYEGYLSTHPNGRYARDARVRVAELERVEAKAPALVKEAKQTPPPPGPGAPEPAGPRWPAADEPFIGADGRIRR